GDLKSMLVDVATRGGAFIGLNPIHALYPANPESASPYSPSSRELGFYLQKGLFEEYAWFGRGHGHDLAPFDDYHNARGLRWP
ncbi:hypothetical protein ONJ45_28105, partial [Salmonella enterica subsp. enterica serovar Virginia]|nr:hypothetical protein [Salmonella enterica subsp. enterica serovar Virginia]